MRHLKSKLSLNCYCIRLKCKYSEKNVLAIYIHNSLLYSIVSPRGNQLFEHISNLMPQARVTVLPNGVHLAPMEVKRYFDMGSFRNSNQYNILYAYNKLRKIAKPVVAGSQSLLQKQWIDIKSYFIYSNTYTMFFLIYINVRILKII